MSEKFLDIKQMMRAVDLRDKSWFQNLSQEQQKLYSPYMTLKWSASVKSETFFEEHYVEMINELVNKHMWTLSKNHKNLLWKLNAMCGSTVNQYHQWIYPKKKKASEKSKMKELQEYYPAMKQSDLNVLDAKLTTKEWNDIKQKHGNDK